MSTANKPIAIKKRYRQCFTHSQEKEIPTDFGKKKQKIRREGQNVNESLATRVQTHTHTHINRKSVNRSSNNHLMGNMTF